jgi:hypothetical protein
MGLKYCHHPQTSFERTFSSILIPTRKKFLIFGSPDEDLNLHMKLIFLIPSFISGRLFKVGVFCFESYFSHPLDFLPHSLK